MIRIGFAIVLLTSAVQCPTASRDLLSLAALNFSLTTEKAKDNQVWQEQGLADCPAPVPGGLRLLASSSEAAAPRANKFQARPSLVPALSLPGVHYCAPRPENSHCAPVEEPQADLTAVSLFADGRYCFMQAKLLQSPDCKGGQYGREA